MLTCQKSASAQACLCCEFNQSCWSLNSAHILLLGILRICSAVWCFFLTECSVLLKNSLGLQPVFWGVLLFGGFFVNVVFWNGKAVNVSAPAGMPSVRICLKFSSLFGSLPAPPVLTKLLAGVEIEAGGKGSELLKEMECLNMANLLEYLVTLFT